MDGAPAHLTPAHLASFQGAIDRILTIQEPSGAIPWFEQGAFDPWNHTESAMALMAAGQTEAAAKAYAYLAESQLSDGAWMGEYGNALPMVDRDYISREKAPAVKDSNFCAYPAVGIYHRYLIDQDMAAAQAAWPMIAKAMAFVMSLQSPFGDIAWSQECLGGPDEDSLLAGNASIAKSMACAIALGQVLGQEVGAIEASREALVQAIQHRPERFDRRKQGARYAMDWYYPLLSGVLSADQGADRLNESWDRFVVPGLGCRCVEDEPWVTAAETAELVLALVSVGEKARALSLFETLKSLQSDDGIYWMGQQFAEDIIWPREQPSWTQAAIILAADAFWGQGEASQLLVKPVL